MTAPTLHLPAAINAQIRSIAESAYPDECCGILVGQDSASDRHVTSIVTAKNTATASEQHYRFTLDPALLLHTERQAAAGGATVLGFYHSHPDHAAQPSEFDRAHAWSFYSYLIVSVCHSRSAELTSWQYDDASERFVAQKLLVTPTEIRLQH